MGFPRSVKMTSRPPLPEPRKRIQGSKVGTYVHPAPAKGPVQIFRSLRSVPNARDVRKSRLILRLTGSASPCTLRLMKLSITEARKRLPELVGRVRKNAATKVEITVRDEVVAELRPALPKPEAGAAAKKLLSLMRKLPKHRGAKRSEERRVGKECRL